ncbi:MAG: DNA translocase FtsK, partial [Lachnospiraceae bacterium]|nr:DNA translocase FtsK [Lachnospiraceae bacterium]
MSLIYKADPNDVKLIMIDPKVVELSIYNSLPHLCIPVVSDPKKAAAALHWAVVEMDERYRKFAELGVRDLLGFNKKIETLTENPNLYRSMPQIVIIVDELADLMMVASHEVEDSICRLAQKARACGIHLIIATQRPSVDVITGLIKANIPSRIAFAVSSQVDSRTILDSVGAEKLLGKGDMLFFPQGFSKPVRVQGAFVSDDEVARVTEFIQAQYDSPIYDQAIDNKINEVQFASNQTASASAAAAEADDNGRDAIFAEAGRFVIEKQKASIGVLQRVFKIGFNRGARIMDQLCEAGVVSDEDGKKPRNILMTMEEFERMIEEGR